MSGQPPVVIGLSAVVVAGGSHAPEVLLRRSDNGFALPSGSFDPDGHRTFELAVRDFVTAQTGFALGYVEQLYTFGDKGREAPAADLGAGAGKARVVSVGYLALAPDLGGAGPREGLWSDWRRFFPWEDQRNDAGREARAALQQALARWAGTAAATRRVIAAFGMGGIGWHEERVLDRYELLYEAGLVAEAARDRGPHSASPHPASGEAMASDHRRILATAIGRLRAKIKYRPIVFDLAPERFTLSELQDLVEGLAGVRLHKQNFRRTLERSGLVDPTDAVRADTGGRPAKLFRRADLARMEGASGLNLPLARG